GKLIVSSAVGNMTLEKPHAFLLDTTNQFIEDTLNVDFIITGNVVSFDIPAYPAYKTLVVQVDRGKDPAGGQSIDNLEWSTYFGGDGMQICMDVETNSNSEAFVAGNTIGTDFPEFLGPHYIIDGSNCFIAKFSNTAMPKWVTFFGGTANETLFEMKVDNDGNCYSVGTTTSSDFPDRTDNGIDYSVIRGSRDGFFFVINADGDEVLCDSYIGGDGDDFAFSIDIYDNAGIKNIAIGGATTDATNFPVFSSNTSDYFQDFFGGAYTCGIFYDGFIMRLDENLNPIWSSLFGGKGVEVISDLEFTEENGIVAVGTTSTFQKASSIPSNTPCAPPTDGSFPDCSLSDAYNQDFIGGSGDYFIAEFNNQNQLHWSTYFGGNKYETAQITLDYPPVPRVMCAGKSISLCGLIVPTTTTFPIKPLAGAYNQPLNGTNQNIFIGMFGASREQLWCSQYGGIGSDNYYPSDICPGPFGSIFLTGWADADAIAPLSEYCQVPTSGNFPICNQSGQNYMETDAGTPGTGEDRTFLLSFDSDSRMIWSSRYGNGNENRGYGISANNIHLFVSGYSGQNDPEFYTLVDLDDSNPYDYFRPNNSGYAFDGTICRFDISLITTGEHKTPDGIRTAFLFPNPSSDFVTICSPDTKQPDFSLAVYDLTGRIVETRTGITQSQVTIDVRSYSEGVYIIQVIEASGETIRTKFIKQ
ncbi:MAG: T9SS type A sorting domain-containing protein, partial [Bacteroidetes bacterium]|nr:T9SS type A sorting domain-containing protein [Bacteroidota bacterium]